jgi:hypothetical protein
MFIWIDLQPNNILTVIKDVSTIAELEGVKFFTPAPSDHPSSLPSTLPSSHPFAFDIETDADNVHVKIVDLGVGNLV